ncbi:hypothetical protein JW859_13480 [bacterium]|nr:hypothetical protein [bacterium]
MQIYLADRCRASWSFLLITIAIACSMAGCTLSSVSTEAPVDGDTPGAQVAPAIPDLSWPPPDERTTSSSYSFTGYNTNGISDGSSKEGLTVHVRSGDDAFGWARFKLGGFGPDRVPYQLNLGSHLVDTEAWVGVGDFAKQQWRWLGAWSSAGEAGWALPGGLDLVSELGNVHLVFVVVGDHALDLVAGGSIECLDAAAGPPFPRLGMWYPDWDRNTVAECARYDVVIDNFGGKYLYWDEEEPLWSDALRAANPAVELMQYVTFSEIPYGPEWAVDGEHYNWFMPDWPDEWFLTEAGTELAGGIDASQTTLTVSDWTQSGEAQYEMPTTWDIFHADGDVLCDGEIMTVTGLDESSRTLTVERGSYESGTATHAAGARIAPIIRFWPGTYVMNLTNDCPDAVLHGAAAPENWVEYCYRMGHAGEPFFIDLSADVDGYLFDRTEDTQSWLFWDTAHSVDLDHDNVAESFADFDAAWLAGVEYMTLMFETGHAGRPIFRNNGGGRRFPDYHGNHFESWPLLAGWDEWPGRTVGWHTEMFGVDEDFEPEWVDRFGGVMEWRGQSPEPNYTWIETYEDEEGPDGDGGGEYENPFDQPGFVPNYQKMRWGLTSALIAGAYFSYEINTAGHGSLGLMWFDEYDNAGAGRGWLGYPLGEAELLYAETVTENEITVQTGVYGREYSGGYAVCNPLDHAQAVDLPAGDWQRIAGTQDTAVNDGSVVDGPVTVPAYDGIVVLRK